MTVLLLSGCRGEQPAKSAPRSSTPVRLHQFTGAPARLVWVQDLFDNTDVSARGEHLRLMGFDSEDGKGERSILSGPDHFFRPLITPSGRQVIFSDFHQRLVYIVDWSGTNRRFLTRGRALAVWQDPESSREWVYVGRRADNNPSGPGSNRLYRVQLENPNVEELVWDIAPFGEEVHVSADGKRISAEVSGAGCALIDIDAQVAHRQGKGCWPAVAPDQSYRFWFFDGAHRNLEMVDTRKGTRNRIYLADAPGIEGHELYHPRWSNHPRYMVMSGPYTIRRGGNNIRGGGGGVEIYAGRFNADYSDIEEWLQITMNQRADFYPDLWVARDQDTLQEVQSVVSSAQPPAQDVQWPVSHDNLLFAWHHIGAENTWTSPEGQHYQAESIPEGKARFGVNYQMDLGTGWYQAGRFPKPEPAEYAHVRALSLEFVVTLSGEQTHGRVLTLGEDTKDLTILRLEQGVLVLEEKRAAGQSQLTRLGQLAAGENHVVLGIEPALVTCTVNAGDPAEYPRNGASLTAWPLMMGDTRPGTNRNVLLERVAVYTRALHAQERHRAAELFEQIRNNTSYVQPLVVKAELTATSSIPAPDDILPYRRGLVVNEYHIVEVVQGAIEEKDKDILVAHWAILDGKRLPEVQRKVGELYKLRLDSFENRPELEGERLSMDSDNLLLNMYYDLDF